MLSKLSSGASNYKGILGDQREHVDQRRRPVEAAVVDDARGDVAGDDRLFMHVGNFLQDPLLVFASKQRRAVVEEAADEGVFGVVGEADRLQMADELILIHVDRSEIHSEMSVRNAFVSLWVLSINCASSLARSLMISRISATMIGFSFKNSSSDRARLESTSKEEQVTPPLLAELSLMMRTLIFPVLCAPKGRCRGLLLRSWLLLWALLRIQEIFVVIFI